MKVECTKVSGERLELEIGEACFVSDLKVGKHGEGCCLWSLGGLDFMGGETWGYGVVFLMTCPMMCWEFVWHLPCHPVLSSERSSRSFTDHHFHQSLPRVRGYV